MKWFQGSISEAVAASKSKKAIFVVFIEGKDEVSQQVAQSLNSTEVSSRLETEKFVAIKLESDSQNYILFTQIYHLVPIPSIFFIGETGIPLEIIGNPLSASDLASKIDSLLSIPNAQPKQSSANLIEAEQKAQASSSSANQETNKPIEKSNTEPTASTLSETSSNLSTENATSSTVTSATEKKNAVELSQEEKLKRAKELIELQNKKKQEEEERKEREREIERRKMGKDIQKLKQQQQDREIKEAQEEILKVRAAEAAAREKVLKQIAQDKLERKKKHEAYLQEHQQKKNQEEAQARTQATTSTDMTKTRIQFKLPTGNSITGTFEATNTLSTLRTYVVQNAQLSFQQFSMSSFFPRKDFTSVDDNKTLLELELVPSSVILILPIKSSNPTSVIKSADGAGIFSHFIWTLLAPVVSIYNYLVGYFTGRPRGDSNSNESRNSENDSNEHANASLGRFINIRARRVVGGNQETTKIRSRGNIHVLHSGDNDNDENNTWNGNSTQQM